MKQLVLLTSIKANGQLIAEILQGELDLLSLGVPNCREHSKLHEAFSLLPSSALGELRSTSKIPPT